MADVITLSSDEEDNNKAPNLKRKLHNSVTEVSKRSKYVNNNILSINNDTLDDSIEIIQIKKASPIIVQPSIQEKVKQNAVTYNIATTSKTTISSVYKQTGVSKNKTNAQDCKKTSHSLVTTNVNITKPTNSNSISNTKIVIHSPVITPIKRIKPTSVPSSMKTSKEVENESEPSTSKEKGPQVQSPRLTIMRKEAVPPILYQSTFEKFCEACLRKESNNEMLAVLTKVKKKYDKLNSQQKNVLAELLTNKTSEIARRDSKVYLHIQVVSEEMKILLRFNKRTVENNVQNDNKSKKEALSNEEVAKVNEITNVEERVKSNEQEVTSNNEAVMKNDKEVVESNEEAENSDEETMKCDEESVNADEETLKNEEPVAPNENRKETRDERKRRKDIRMIDRVMRICEKRIKKYESQEVNFNDEDNSSFIKWERYKKRLIDLYNKRCRYTGESVDAGRSYLRPKHMSPTSIPQVDRAIMSFINSKIVKRNKLAKKGRLADVVVFPDYHDILNCIHVCNVEQNLGLDPKLERAHAEKAFEQIGSYLQRMRREDYWETFRMYLDAADEDPALNSPELMDKLRVNKANGDKKMNALFEEYVKKQEGVQIDPVIALNSEEVKDDKVKDKAIVVEVKNKENNTDVKLDNEDNISKHCTEVTNISTEISAKSIDTSKKTELKTTEDLKSNNKLSVTSVEEVIEVDKCPAKKAILRVKSFAKYNSPTKNGPESNSSIKLNQNGESISTPTVGPVILGDTLKNVSTYQIKNDTNIGLLEVKDHCSNVGNIDIKQVKRGNFVYNSINKTINSSPTVINNNLLNVPMVHAKRKHLELDTGNKCPVLFLRTKKKALIFSSDTEPMGNITICDNVSNVGKKFVTIDRMNKEKRS